MEFHIIMYTVSAYVIAYFFLSIFISLILFTGNHVPADNGCKIDIYSWYCASAFFYTFGFIITGMILFFIRRVNLDENVVVIRQFIFMFKSYPRNWFYIYLFALELLHLSLTIWGSVLNFSDINSLLTCYTDLTLLANFMFILVILGYIYFLRMCFTTLHFWLGYKILTFFKRRIRCLRKNELHMK